MHSRFSPLQLAIFTGILVGLLVMLQLNLFSIAFERLGLSRESAFTLLLTSLLGSAINLPLFTIRAQAPPAESLPPPLRRSLHLPQAPFTGVTMIALNVGGCLIPVSFSIYLLRLHPLLPGDVILATALVSAVSYAASRPIQGLGVGMPILIAPLTAALAALLINPAERAPLAYISGTWGVLLGADLLRLKDVRHMGAPVASIGGAGTFDGIFITGIVAVLLA
ncbi:MAG: DUF1614 domain-containing protein [Candidatus Competibacteraceae bacterium]